MTPMSIQRFTYPAPARYSRETDSRVEKRSVWRLKKAAKSEYNIFGLNLARDEAEVTQRLFTSESWTSETALRAILAGAWFDYSQDFASKQEKAFALAAQASLQIILDTGEVQPCHDAQQ